MAIRPLKKRSKKALMVEAMNAYMNIVTVACKQVGISRETHYKWMKTDKSYKYFIEETKFHVKDFGENALLKLMKDKNPAAIIFFNKTINKDRGYFEKQEIEHSTGEKGIIINLIEKSVEEIKNDKSANKPKAEGTTESAK